ncbi:DUF2304 family protein [Candidatus Woesearchaeota archaeon]|nr:DUF2304 family protein [Candidatus Woesearchaeota archaeon]
MITFMQLLALAFMSFVSSRAVLRAKDKKISIGELFFWLGVWSALIFVVFFPDFTTRMANLVGIGRGIDIIFYTSIAILFYMIFRLYVKLEDTERELTKVVRKLSMMTKKRK